MPYGLKNSTYAIRTKKIFTGSKDFFGRAVVFNQALLRRTLQVSVHAQQRKDQISVPSNEFEISCLSKDTREANTKHTKLLKKYSHP